MKKTAGLLCVPLFAKMSDSSSSGKGSASSINVMFPESGKSSSVSGKSSTVSGKSCTVSGKASTVSGKASTVSSKSC